MGSARSLVIVESPAKARTIANFLGKDFVVESSIGHIRDLPRSASEIPPPYNKMKWARRLGVDVENGFKPLYLVDADKKTHIARLKDLLKDSKELYLATDEDREGESIAWHLLEVLKPRVPVKRMVFHEITPTAIQHAIAHPRDVDRRLVDAQEARRILDRLVGYEVSPVLWKKIRRGLSAGRVQSVATRVIVEREKQRMSFVKTNYWGIDALFGAGATAPAESKDQPQSFPAALVGVNDKRVATSKDFDDRGNLTRPNTIRLDEAAARALAASIVGTSLKVESVERKPSRRSPAAPFMTSTLQQEASRKLRFSAKRTMQAAQHLYESGFITYMRTDSTQLSTAALTTSRALIERLYGLEYLPKEPRIYTKKVKNAQEAHEAIRPAGETFKHPEEVARLIGSDEARLYELVWTRTIASQMTDALGESVQVKIVGNTTKSERVEFAANGYSLIFPGFLRAYVEGSDDPAAELESRERHLPRLADGQQVPVLSADPKPHETQPPARFTEASLVQKLEELGVGRPSTYASTISTIIERGYVWKKGAALVPSFTAFAVVQLLERHFDKFVDYAFTAKMEDELDAIAEGEQTVVPWLERFYFGAGGPRTERLPIDGDHSLEKVGLKSLVEEGLDLIDARAINSITLGKDPQGRDVVVRVGRYGPYLAREETMARIPLDMPPDELTLEKAIELLDAPQDDRVLGVDEASGKTVYVKKGRYGAYVQLGEREGKDDKPKTSSLRPSMSPDTVTLEEAQRLLSLPRLVGADPKTNQPIEALYGPYGPYIRRGGKDSRSLASDEEVFTIGVDAASALFDQPKTRARRAAPEPVKTMGNDPVSGQPVKIFQGRFGYYVTDGTTNATLRRDDAPETLSDDRAFDLLKQRREKDAEEGGSKGGRGRRGGPKRGGPKRAAAPVKDDSAEVAAPKKASRPPKAKAAPKVAAPKKTAKKPAAKKPATKSPKKAAKRTAKSDD
ncbi:MAG: type I DNA topoisomerase [Polyangiaceae bacterium]